MNLVNWARGIGFTAILALAFDSLPIRAGDQDDWGRVERWAQALSAKYGFKVVIARQPGEDESSRTSFGGTSYQPADLDSYERYLMVLEESLGRLPDDFLKRAGARQLVLCGEIEHYGGKVPGVKSHREPLLYLDARRVTDDKVQQAHAERLTLFHEIYHIVDYDIYFDKLHCCYDDGTWNSLNSPDFRYVNMGGEKPINVRQLEKMPGFLTSYSRQSIAEDKAELFSWMMVRPDFVKQKIKDDSILRAKVANIKSVMLTRYKVLDDRFWLENENQFFKFLINRTQ